MSEKPTMISIRGVSKRFGDFVAVNDARFDIREGEFFSLLGASGSGKTTLLRILAGFEAASEGEVHIDGQPIDAVPPHERPVNMVFQSYAIFPHLNVRDNIGFGLRKFKLDKQERRRRIDEMLELIKLPDYGDRGADQLSGGQRQRVALARALVLRPKVLLLDEPLGALDKQLREQMQTELRELQRSVGITFVLVTHDQEEAMALSDRIAVMADGKVLQIDTPAGLYERPKTRSVASFVGSMNFLPGDLAKRASGQAAPDYGSSDLIAIRPERITLHLDQPKESNGAGPALHGHLADRVYLGERVQYKVELDGCAERIAVSAPNTEPIVADPGTTVWLSWPPEAVIPLKDT